VQYMAKQIGGEFRFLTQEELAIKKAEQELAELKARRRA